MTTFSEIFKDKTAYTSPEYSMPTSGGPFAEMWVAVTGNGPVYIDLKGEDGVWRTFPECTFTGTTAQRIAVRRGRFRVRIAASVATTVEISV